jgi:hypothetical protein
LGGAPPPPHHGCRVPRVDQQPHPCQDVADLGALEQGLHAAARLAALLWRSRDPGRGHHTSIRAPGHGNRRSGVRTVGAGQLSPRGERGRGEARATLLKMDAIDWSIAQRIGERIAGSPPPGGVRAGAVQPLAYDFAERVGSYSGLPVPSDLPPLEAVDRPAWIAANLKNMRPLLGPLSERVGDGTGPLAGPLRAASGFLLGAQLGALTGILSQRVLGQYDLALLDASTPPRLLLLAPNLALTARNMGVDRDELVLWVSIHEITHAVQFAGAPWLPAAASCCA